MLKQLGEKYKKHDWGWMWSEGGAQNDLEEVFDVGGFGYPALVGAFTKNNINDFLILLAKANAVNINEDIASKIVEVESWDHKDIIEVLLEELDDVDIAKDEL
ncbi:hypothetical protein NQ317_006019 [Molorchus minor]|uniref:Ankyrin repeat domain-containing protein n=1 Tax=Molorchus minor TaxID=1323400 RepID=A0ABQ9IVY0_9CUCU|nr:hypothetical protein NQ317_006019 [Molorchus minor]